MAHGGRSSYASAFARTQSLVRAKHGIRAFMRPYSLPDAFVFLDVETTGLDPSSDHILEVGAIFTTPDLEVLSRFHAVLQPPVGWTWLPVVREMHTRSGLLDCCQAQTADLDAADIDRLLCQSFDSLRPLAREPNTAPRVQLAGHGAAFDLRFLHKHCPAFAQRLHYRVLDVSGLLTAQALWGGWPLPPQASTHRAMADCEMALENARRFRALLADGREAHAAHG